MEINDSDSKIYERNPVLLEQSFPDTELKKWLIEYVGNRHGPESGEVTVEMIVGTIAQEFPEFLLAVAEENFFRGYEQALNDFQEADNKRTENEKNNQSD